MRRRRTVLLAATIALFALACGKSIARIPIGPLGESGETELDLPAGTKLLFALHEEGYSYESGGGVVIDAKFLKNGKKVGTFTCTPFLFKSGGGGGCGSTTAYNSECETTVPKQGADTIRVHVHSMADSPTVQMKGIEVDVRQL